MSVDASITSTALGSPQGAARYLNSQNMSSYVNSDEAALVVQALNKVASSDSASRAFLDEWKKIYGTTSDSKVIGTIKLNMSAFTVETEKLVSQSIVLGSKIYQNATKSTQSEKTTADTTMTTATQEQPNALDEIIGKAKDIATSITSVLPDEYTASEMKTTTSVNIRDEPSTSGNKVATLTSNATVQISNKSSGVSGWTRIIYNGKPAYVSSQYLKPTSSATTAKKSTSAKTTMSAPSPVTQQQSILTSISSMSTANKVIISAGVLLSIIIITMSIKSKHQQPATA